MKHSNTSTRTNNLCPTRDSPFPSQEPHPMPGEVRRHVRQEGPDPRDRYFALFCFVRFWIVIAVSVCIICGICIPIRVICIMIKLIEIKLKQNTHKIKIKTKKYYKYFRVKVELALVVKNLISNRPGIYIMLSSRELTLNCHR